jgi:hypothetical protein
MVLPVPVLTASPGEVALIVATVRADEVHFALAEMFPDVPSL